MNDQLTSVQARLESLRTRQKRLLLSSSLQLAVSAALVFWMLSIVLEANFHLDSLARGIVLALSILVTIAAIGFAIVRVLSFSHLSKGRIAEEFWALKLGAKTTGEAKDRLLNAIQVNRERLGARDKQSDALAQAALYSAVAKLPEVSDEDVIDRTHLRLAVRTIIAVGIACAGVFLVSPGSMTSALGRIFSPGEQFVQPNAFALHVSHPTGWAYRGESVKFTVTADGNTPRSVDFVYVYPGGAPVKKSVKLIDSTAEVQIEQFTESVEYFAIAEDIQSEKQQLKIVTRPQVTQLQYTLVPPRYSKLPTVTGEDNIGDVEALPGSKLDLKVRLSKPVSEAGLVFLKNGSESNESDTIAFEIAGQRAAASWRLYRAGTYHVSLIDREGHPNLNPIKYRIELMRDESPSVFIEYPDVDLDLGDAMAVPLKVVAEDDFGISRLTLKHRILGPDSTVNEMPLDFDKPTPETALTEMLWDVSALSVFPGDVIEYWVVGLDNDNIGGPKSAESERRLLRFPTFEEILAGVETTEEEAMTEAESAVEAAKELREEVSEIIEEMRRNPEVDWERQQQLESAMQKQADLEKQVQEIGEKIDELVQRMEENDLLAQETMEKYQELQELIAEVATPELREAMEKLQQAMQEQDPEKIREAMEQFDLDREQFLERIERSLEIFKQLQLERKLDELAKMTEDLLHQQEEILDQMGERSTEELASREEQLSRSTEMMLENLENVRELAEEAGENDLANKLDSLAQVAEQKQIPQTMNQMSGQMRSGQMPDAKESGEQAARELASMAGAFQQTAQEFKENKLNDMAKKLRRMAEDLLYVSRDQEELAIESINLGTNSPRYRMLSSRQDDIMENVINLTNRLYELSKETFFITPQLGAEMGKAAEQIDRAIQDYSDRNPRTVRRPQTQAMGSLNLSAMQLLDILNQMEGASSSSGYEEMMERLNQMAQQQQGLNEQSMMMPNGQQPMQMPGGQGQDSFQRMAARQRALEESMKQMAEEAGEGMREVLGDLDNIAKDMGEVANDFEDHNIEERTRRLQRQIVSRLLDATRSVREQEYSKQRESKSSRSISRRSPDELQLDSDEDQLQRDLLRALQQGYTRDYRRLIRKYFNELQDVKAAETQNGK